MAKKPELLEKAKKLKLEVTQKNTIAELEAAIKAAETILKPAKVAKIEKETAVKTEAPEDEVKLAKAGKRSEKAIKEVEEKIAKEERKEKGEITPQSAESAHVKKGAKPVTRPLIERRGKNYRKVAELIDKSVVYPLTEAMAIAVKTNPSKFDASLEIHVRLGVDPRQADQNVRATVSLPNGTGKTIRVAVFAPESEHAAAKKAGADIVGDEDFLKQLDKEEINFDILIATPQYMPKLGKYARLLGPRGLMPNPKSGSVAANVSKAVTEAKSGKVEYRVDKQAIIHLSVGKVSFGAKKLEENAIAFFDSLKTQKPAGLKGAYVKTTSISTTQGPGIKVQNVVS
ncbi:MAG TPA: 50S ribosomal protein L1 [Candidatus Saccharimonadales bacterium]|nr:50S ribosomal protein L1 [Candidatus Saccharimonadales bacterium]